MVYPKWLDKLKGDLEDIFHYDRNEARYKTNNNQIFDNTLDKLLYHTRICIPRVLREIDKACLEKGRHSYKVLLETIQQNEKR